MSISHWPPQVIVVSSISTTASAKRGCGHPPHDEVNDESIGSPFQDSFLKNEELYLRHKNDSCSLLFMGRRRMKAGGIVHGDWRLLRKRGGNMGTISLWDSGTKKGSLERQSSVAGASSRWEYFTPQVLERFSFRLRHLPILLLLTGESKRQGAPPLFETSWIKP